MLDFNEGKACDAIVRRLKAREGLLRSELRWPEQEGHCSPVEVAFKLGDELFTLEHTGIEPFPGRAVKIQPLKGRLGLSGSSH